MQNYLLLPEWVQGWLTIPAISLYFAGMVAFVTALNSVVEALHQMAGRLKGVIFRPRSPKQSQLLLVPNPSEIAKFSVQNVSGKEAAELREFLQEVSMDKRLSAIRRSLELEKSNTRLTLMAVSFISMFATVLIRFLVIIFD